MADKGIAAPSAEPNVTPLIDVLLVLLITFMIVAAQKRKSMDASLPIPCAAACDGGGEIVLEVLPGPAYRINRSEVASGELRERLASIFAGRRDKIIEVAGRPGVAYADVIDAMDVAKSAGVRVIGIAPKDLPAAT